MALGSRSTRVALATVAVAVVAAAGLLIPATAPPAAAAVTSGRTLRVVQLGDSYSAGNGGGDYYGPVGCYRSRQNWGEQYSSWLRAQGYAVNYANNACSGSLLPALTSNNTLPGPAVTTPLATGETITTSAVTRRLRARCAVGTDPEETVTVSRVTRSGTSAKATCTRVLPPQINAVNSQTDLVLMTIGGNDVNFGSIVQNCFALVDRSPSGCRDRVTAARDALPDVRTRLETVLTELRARMPAGGRVVLLTYPYLSDRSSWVLRDARADVGLSSGHSYDAGAAVRSLGNAGDAAQIAAARAANRAAGYSGAPNPAGGSCTRTITPAAASPPGRFVTVVDTTKCHFAGHEPDPSALNRNPNRWMYEFLGANVGESYHPTPRGQTEEASLLRPFGDFGASARSAIGGTVVVNADGRRRGGVRGVAVSVTGTDASGNAVSRATVTDGDGSWRVENLPPGVYSVREAQPSDLLNAGSRLGSVSGAGSSVGVAGVNQVSQIVLNGVGSTATGYTFVEQSRDWSGRTTTGGSSGRVDGTSGTDGTDPATDTLDSHGERADRGARVASSDGGSGGHSVDAGGAGALLVVAGLGALAFRRGRKS